MSNPRADELRRRTERFAVEVVAFSRTLPDTIESRRIRQQLTDAATSVAANCRAACRARSRAEFISKIGTVLEEADESEFWLTLIVKTNLATTAATERPLKEAGELTAIFASSARTAKSRR
jgi:four helix bundle protein